MAESRQLSDFGVVSLLLIHQPTLRDALVTTMKYRHLLNELLAIHVEERGRTVVIREEFVPDPGPTSRQAIELALGALYRLCGFLLGPHWKPHSVNFTHGAPENLLVHRRVFRCATEFDREFNGIVCDAADLNLPQPVRRSGHGRSTSSAWWSRCRRPTRTPSPPMCARTSTS